MCVLACLVCGLGGDPGADPETRWRDYISRLALERLGIPQEELESVGWGEGSLGGPCLAGCPRDPAPDKRTKMDGLLRACLPKGATVETVAGRPIHYTPMQSFIFPHSKMSRWTFVALVFTFFYWSLFPAVSPRGSCRPPAFTVGLNETGGWPRDLIGANKLCDRRLPFSWVVVAHLSIFAALSVPNSVIAF